MKKFLLFFVPVLAFAQEAAAEALKQPAWFEKLVSQLPPAQASGIIVAIGGVIEFLLGMIKTEKPQRLALWVASGFKKIHQVIVLASSMLLVLAAWMEKWAEFLDKVLPQRLKAPQIK